jgi:DNA-damage-inducible protein J
MKSPARAANRTADTYVRARIDSATKKRAADALAAMGMSISDGIRLLMFRVVDERRLPFDVKAPNATTRKAIAELGSGYFEFFSSLLSRRTLTVQSSAFKSATNARALRKRLPFPDSVVAALKARLPVDPNSNNILSWHQR